MKPAVNILVAIRNLAGLLKEKASDATTLDALIACTHDRSTWQKAHGLFNEIRAKTNKATEQGNVALESQYRFEEICAKTLYNLGHHSAPFDPDSPYWIIPNALDAARQMDIDQGRVLQAIRTEPNGPANGSQPRM